MSDQESVCHAATTMQKLACTRPTPEQLALLRTALGERDVVWHVSFEGVPHVFRAEWHVWEMIRDVVSRRTGASRAYTRITGSANRGYRFRDGRPFDPETSDLDLFIVDQTSFEQLEAGVRRAIEAIDKGHEWAATWRPNSVKLTRHHLRRGFVQTNRLPPRMRELSRYQRCTRAIRELLERHSSVKRVKSISYRVYRDEAAAHEQLARGLAP